MNIHGKPIKTIYFTRFCKDRLGYGHKENVRLYDLVCIALEADDMPMPMNMTSKQWVKENLDHIIGANELEKLKSCASQHPTKKIRRTPKARISNKVTLLEGVDVKSDAFLSTFQWRKVRMEALKKYGPRCQCCGATPADGAVMNVDHIKPRKLRPDLALDVANLQVLCHECNHGKGNWDQTDWRKP